MAQRRKKSYYGRGRIISRGIVKAEPREGRPKKNPTYLGKRLRRSVDNPGALLYANDLADVEGFREEDGWEWTAGNRDTALQDLYDSEIISEVSAQDALDRLQEQTIKAFQALGEKLGYDVED
jgi:hypothetical protein